MYQNVCRHFYNQEEQNYKIPLPYLTEGLYCACKYEGFWHRAVITGIRKNGTINVSKFKTTSLNINNQ